MARMTRRAWAAAVAAAPATLAQTPPAAQAPKAEPADLLEQQRRQVRRNLDQLASYKIDLAVEPASRFEA